MNEQPQPTKAKRPRKKIEPTGDFVRLERVAALFDVSADFIRDNSVALGIGTARVLGELRAWWPDALALRDRLRKQAANDLGYADRVIDITRGRRAG